MKKSRLPGETKKKKANGRSSKHGAFRTAGEILADDNAGPSATATPAELQGPTAGADKYPGNSADSRQADRQHEWTQAGTKQQADMTEASSSQHLHVVTFALGGEEYGIEIGRVQEIIRVGHITHLPNTGSFIEGVINLRGRIIPVLSLRKKLSLSEQDRTRQSRILIVEHGARVLGMLVDAVVQVLMIPESAVDDSVLEDQAGSHSVRGIGNLDKRLIMILNMDRVLAGRCL